MPLTPLQTTHVLSFSYAVQGLTHHQHMYVDAAPSGDPTGFSLIGAGASPEPMTDAIDEWEDLIGPVLGLGTTQAGVTLYSVNSFGLVPVYSGAIPTITPGGGITLTEQLTVFFRDSLNKPFKLTLFETNEPVPFHSASSLSADIGVAMANLIADVLNRSNGHLGAWMHARSDDFALRYIAITSSLNRKIRRRRGFA